MSTANSAIDMTSHQANNSQPNAGGEGVRCENCGGSGVISYNPNLNPDNFPGKATAKCTRCGGTGIEDTANADRREADDAGIEFEPCDVCGGTEANFDGFCPQCELAMEAKPNRAIDTTRKGKR